MRFARRLSSWLLFIAVFTTVGAAVFFLVRSQPRCTIKSSHFARLLSADGTQVLTNEWEVWDTHTGERLRVLDTESLASFYYANDGRTIGLIYERKPLRLIDWTTGQHWDLDEPTFNTIDFSAKGRWLIVGEDGKSSSLYDVAARKFVMRTRHPMTVSADERTLFVPSPLPGLPGPGELSPENHVAVWNLEDGKPCGVLPLKRTEWQASPDGRFVAEEHHDELIGLVGVNVWDVAKRERRFYHPLPKPGWMHTRFSRNGHRLAVWSEFDYRKSWKLEIIDTNSGKVLGTTDTPARPSEEKFAFSPDGALVFSATRRFAAMMDADTGALLWRRDAQWAGSYFPQNAAIVFRQDDPNAWGNFVDARSGKIKAAIPVTFYDDALMPTPDGRFCVIPGRRFRADPPNFWQAWLDKHWPRLLDSTASCVVVMETASWSEQFRAVNCGESAVLSPDGSTLVTSENLGTDANPGPIVLRVWEVQPTTAWRWAVAAALGTGLVWQLSAWMRRVCRKRRAA